MSRELLKYCEERSNYYFNKALICFIQNNYVRTAEFKKYIDMMYLYDSIVKEKCNE